MPPTPEWITCTETSSWWIFEISSTAASTEPCTSALMISASSLSAPSCICENRSSRLTALLRLASISVRLRWARCWAVWRATRSFSTTRQISPAGGGRSKPRISTGTPGPASLTRLPLWSFSAFTRPQASPATTASPTCSVPRCTSIVATGPRPTSRRDSMMTPLASAFGLAFSSSTSACSRIEFRSLSRFVPRLGGHVLEDGVPAPLLRLQAVRDQLVADALGVRVGPVDLVHGDDDRHPGGLGMVDRLDRLRHDAVVGGDHQHGHVGDLGAAGAHGGEGLVARGVEEGDLAPVADVDLVGADVLGDPAGLGGDHRRLADRVEQGRLAVVDVAHDRDDRRPRDEVLLLVLEDDLLLVILVVGVLDDDLALELAGDQLDGIVGERHGQRHHLAQAHHQRDDLGGRDAELLGQVLDGDARGHLDGAGGSLGLALGLGPRRSALAAHGRLAAGLGVDHDAALALGGGAALGPGGTAGLRRPLLGGRGGLGAERALHLVVIYQLVSHFPPSTL